MDFDHLLWLSDETKEEDTPSKSQYGTEKSISCKSISILFLFYLNI